MVEGESGILAVAHDDFRPVYEPSKRRLTYPTGAIQTTYSADEPDRLRGPQHNYGWIDELAAMKRGHGMWDMFSLGLRLGQHPQALITTTPRPLKWLREILHATNTVATGGSTYDNLDNLAPTFRKAVLDRYEGTRLGRQELHAELLEDVEGALWSIALIDRDRLRETPPMGRIVVSVDPAVTSGPDSDETGIIVVGTILGSNPTEFAVIADRSGRYSPQTWGELAGKTADEFGADAIVAETNQGGDLVKATLALAAPWARYKPVHATHSKRIRAEPVAALYEQGRVHHVGDHPLLEDQMATWVPDTANAKSPDRLDALVHGITDLASWDIPKARKVRT
jgi:phage terminase large subunit-like protein